MKVILLTDVKDIGKKSEVLTDLPEKIEEAKERFSRIGMWEELDQP